MGDRMEGPVTTEPPVRPHDSVVSEKELFTTAQAAIAASQAAIHDILSSSRDDPPHRYSDSRASSIVSPSRLDYSAAARSADADIAFPRPINWLPEERRARPPPPPPAATSTPVARSITPSSTTLKASSRSPDGRDVGRSGTTEPSLSTSPHLRKQLISPADAAPDQTLPAMQQQPPLPPSSTASSAPQYQSGTAKRKRPHDSDQSLPSFRTLTELADVANHSRKTSSVSTYTSPSTSTAGPLSAAAAVQTTFPTTTSGPQVSPTNTMSTEISPRDPYGLISPLNMIAPNPGSQFYAPHSRNASVTSSQALPPPPSTVGGSGDTLAAPYPHHFGSTSTERSQTTPEAHGGPTSASSTGPPDRPLHLEPPLRPSLPVPLGPGGTPLVHPPGQLLGGYKCDFPGCTAPPFQTQYLLNSHANVHSSNRPHYCPVKGCPRAEGGKGFKRKNEMIRHGLVHDSPGYVCPFCPDREHKYPRPDNLQRHVRVHHCDKDKDDPLLREVLAQRPEGGSRGRRRRLGT